MLRFPKTVLGAAAAVAGGVFVAGAVDGGAVVAEPHACPYVEIVERHLAWYPAMEIDDVYKLVHQAVAGPGHAAPDSVLAARWLAKEIEEVGEPGGFPDERVLEPLRPDGGLVRVNLRPYLAAGGRAGPLLAAFLATADAVMPPPARLADEFGAAWECLIAAAEGGLLALSAEAMRTRYTAAAAAGFPAIHHSPGYADAYRPAYRVVDPSLLAGLTDLRNSSR